MIQTRIPQVLNCWSTYDWKDLLQKKEILISQRCSQETRAKQLKIQTNPVYNYSQEVFLLEVRKWNDILSSQHTRGHDIEALVSKLVLRLVRHYDQHERETDGAVHWDSMGPKLRKTFQKVGRHKFSDSDWFLYLYTGSNKTRFKYCKNSRDVLLYIRAFQGHTGGNVIAPELMGHVAIPDKWKEFLFHRGCSYDVISILKSGLITGETRKLRRKTENNDFWDNPDEEEPSEDFSKSRRVHHHSKLKSGQGAVYWINLAQAPDTGLQFCQSNQMPCHFCRQFCAGRLHLQRNFSKMGKNFI